MNTLPLGVGKLIKGCASLRVGFNQLLSSKILDEKRQPRPFSSMKGHALGCGNRMLSIVQKESSPPAFCADFSISKSRSRRNGLYSFDGNVGMLEAADFACLDQIFPFVGALADRLLCETRECPSAKVMKLRYVMLKHVFRRGESPGHTVGDFTALRSNIAKFKDLAKEFNQPYQTSGIGTLKMYLLDHAADDIEQIEPVSSMAADLHEYMHKEGKMQYRRTSRRKGSAMREAAVGMSGSQPLRRMLEGLKSRGFSGMVSRLHSGRKSQPLFTQPASTKMEAVAGGSVALAKQGERVHCAEIRDHLRWTARPGAEKWLSGAGLSRSHSMKHAFLNNPGPTTGMPEFTRELLSTAEDVG